MLQLVIDCVNYLGWCEPSILTSTNRHGQNISDSPQDADSSGNEDVESIVEYPTKTPGVALVTGDAELAGGDPDFDVKPPGVKMDSEAQCYVPEDHNKVDGLRQQDLSKRFDDPTAEPNTVPQVPSKLVKRRLMRVAKKPSAYTPSMTDNKYAVAPTQIVAILKGSKDAMFIAQMSIKVTNKGVQLNADNVGMVMAQLSLKAAMKKWSDKAKYAITAEMKQLPWRDSHKPKH
jgi:hypothetical protein